MPRDARNVEKRSISPDFKYNSKLVSKFVNKIMQSGKKSVSRKIIYQAFDLIEQKTKKPALEVFELAIKNVSPVLQVRPRRIGGATYQVPMEVKKDRKIVMVFGWIIDAVRARKGQSTAKKLANEILDASEGIGAAMKKKEDMHRMAEANRAFAHYAKF